MAWLTLWLALQLPLGVVLGKWLRGITPRRPSLDPNPLHGEHYG